MQLRDDRLMLADETGRGALCGQRGRSAERAYDRPLALLCCAAALAGCASMNEQAAGTAVGAAGDRPAGRTRRRRPATPPPYPAVHDMPRAPRQGADDRGRAAEDGGRPGGRAAAVSRPAIRRRARPPQRQTAARPRRPLARETSRAQSSRAGRPCRDTEPASNHDRQHRPLDLLTAPASRGRNCCRVGRLAETLRPMRPEMMEEFYRIRRLPPYVFEQVNRAKAKARNARRRHRRSRHGQSGPAGAHACDREAGGDGRQAAHRPLFRLARASLACAARRPPITRAGSA